MFRFGLSVLLSGLIIVLTQSGSIAENAGPLVSQVHGITPTVQNEIERGLTALHHLAKAEATYESYAKALGFTSVNQAVKATAGQPLPVYRVSIRQLGNYRAGNKAEGIMEVQPKTLLVPILADGKIRSSFMIVEYADPPSAKIIGQGASNLVVGRNPDFLKTMDAVVLIPDLRLRFFARDTNAGIVLIPIKDYPLFQLKGGAELSADELFTKLAPIAKRAAQAIADRPEPEGSKNSGQPATQ